MARYSEMSAAERSDYRLDFAVRLYGAGMASECHYLMETAIRDADSLIRLNEQFETIEPLPRVTVSAPVISPALKERIKDLGAELNRRDPQFPRILAVFRSLYESCGISREEIQEHVPF